MAKAMIAVAWMAAVAALMWTPDADACSAPACEPEGAYAPSMGQQVPANVPALLVTGNFSNGAQDRPPKLMGPGQTLVAVQTTFESQGWVVRPDAPLTPGETYTLTHDGQCFGHPEGDYSSSFNASEEAPLPTTLGTLTVSQEGTSTISVPAGGSCVTDADGVYRLYEFTPDPSLAPWLPVVAWKLQVNGKPWAQTRHGTMGKEHLLQQDLLRVYALCDNASTLTDAHRGLDEGTHTVELQGFLPGESAPFATLTDTVTLDCDADPASGEGGGGDALPPLGCAAVSTAVPAGLGLLALVRTLRSRRRPASAHKAPRP